MLRILVCALALLPACSSSSAVAAGASAGADRSVAGGTWVVLRGHTENANFLQFRWTQLYGAPVQLLGADSRDLAFAAPQIDGPLVFEFAVVQGTTVIASDRVQVTVESTRRGGSATELSTFPVGGGGEGHACSLAFHAPSSRLFVADGEAGTVEVRGLADPSGPIDHGLLDLGAWFSGGRPRALALTDDWLAVAIEADPATDAGVVQFWDAATLAFLRQVPVGAQPSDVAFDPAGSVCLVACEGAPGPDYLVDPEGTIVRVMIPPGGPANVNLDEDVRVLGFDAWEGAQESLRSAGVRLFGPGAGVAQDLEPESVVLSVDGRHGWAVCQENDALVQLDLVAGEVSAITGLGGKRWDAPQQARSADLIVHPWTPSVSLGQTEAGQEIELGGLAGLAFMGEENGALTFLTTCGRGPVLDPIDLGGDGIEERPFALPECSTRVLRFTLDRLTGTLTLTGEVPLLRADGTTPISGRPNLLVQGGELLAFNDEVPVDLFGAPLELDPFGLDVEAVVQLEGGELWVADHYRPSVARFGADGVLIARYVPLGSNDHGELVGTETLPAAYAQRRLGRGFTGLTYDPARGRLQAWMRSPIDNPDTVDDGASASSRIVRMLELDPADGGVTGEFVQVIEGLAGSDSVGDATWAGSSGEFLLLETNHATGPAAVNVIQALSLDGATNLLDLGPDYEGVAGPGGSLEGTSPEGLADLGIVPMGRTMLANLADAGLTGYSAPHGLARLPDGGLALLTDDAFGLEGATLDTTTGRFEPDPGVEAATAVVMVDAPPVGLDASDVDGAISIEPWPLRSMLQPDGLVRFEVEGETYLATANQGGARVVTGDTGYDERVRVGDLILDTVAFPDAAALQQDTALGRLLVTREDGDLDGDGDHDELWPFGGRSFSIWKPDGERIFDSGDGLARTIALLAPSYFNSSGSPETFDDASPEGGTEPEAIISGEVEGVPFLFLALARLGAVSVHDVRNPAAPTFATLVGSPGNEGPADLCFVPADQSPTGQALLIVAFRLTGSVGIFALEL